MSTGVSTHQLPPHEYWSEYPPVAAASRSRQPTESAESVDHLLVSLDPCRLPLLHLLHLLYWPIKT
jgi:hypothetical protein